MNSICHPPNFHPRWDHRTNNSKIFFKISRFFTRSLWRIFICSSVNRNNQILTRDIQHNSQKIRICKNLCVIISELTLFKLFLSFQIDYFLFVWFFILFFFRFSGNSKKNEITGFHVMRNADIVPSWIHSTIQYINVMQSAFKSVKHRITIQVNQLLNFELQILFSFKTSSQWILNNKNGTKLYCK